MKKMSILDRSGIFISMEWDYNPKNNPDAHKKARKRLKVLNIKHAVVTEVAPACFWYSTPDKELNVEDY